MLENGSRGGDRTLLVQDVYDDQPLSRHSLFRGTSLDEFDAALRLLSAGANRVSSEPLTVPSALNHVSLSKVDLAWIEGLTGVELAISGFRQYVKFFALGGELVFVVDGREIRLHGGELVLIPPGRPLTMRFLGDVRLFTLSFPTAVIESKLAALVGSPGHGPIALDVNHARLDATTRSMLKVIVALVHHIDSHGADASPIYLSESEEYLLTKQLFASRHAHYGLLFHRAPTNGESPLALACDYIEANWMHQIAIEDIARAAGISVRSLFRAFAKTPSRTPMVHLKQVRLRQAHRMLSESGGAATVTEVVFACGFGNTGHFAHDYQVMFGEKPSETLTAARQRRD